MLTNARDAFRGQPRSPNMELLDTLGMLSYYCAIVTLPPRCAVFLTDIRLPMSWPWNLGQRSIKSLKVVPFDRLSIWFPVTLSASFSSAKNTVTLGVTEGHWKWHYLIHHLWLYVVPFLRHLMSKNIATLKSRSRVNQGHWKLYHSIDWVWFPISVL